MSRNKRMFFSTALLLFFSAFAIAQNKPEIRLTAIKQEDSNICVSLTSSKPFIFGSNIYVLYIGNKQFTRNDQWHMDGKGYMTFCITPDEYSSLQDGADIYLAYGELDPEEEDRSAIARSSRKCWSLGKLNRSELKR